MVVVSEEEEEEAEEMRMGKREKDESVWLSAEEDLDNLRGDEDGISGVP